MALLFSLPSLFFLLIAISQSASPDLVLEDGYTVTTLIDGHKHGINPHSVLPRPASSDLIVLDSVNSAVYTVSFPISQEIVVKKLSGNAGPGFSDGDLGSAKFNKPRSIAVDLKGNVYVADRTNFAIRKISRSGVSTIAGGYAYLYPKKTGREDGAAQNATFSEDFELVFVPQKCALLISDHGNGLVRQIDLKAEDCAPGSQSALGSISVWALALGVSCLLGFIIGVAVHRYIIHREGFSPYLCSETWKRCLISLEKQVTILCFDIRSAIASSSVYALLGRLIWLSLSHLSLMFRINNVESQKSLRKESAAVSLLDSDNITSCEQTKSLKYAYQLKDLISFDESLDLSTTEIFNLPRSDPVSDSRGGIDNLIDANISGFVEAAKETYPGRPLVKNSGLVRRK